MKALALLCVLIIAKLAMLAGRPIQLSGWTPFAYFWQDVLVALAFGLFDSLLSRLSAGRFPGWILYGATVVYVAINVPVARVLPSPLTWPMLSATCGTLSDSINHHATAGNFSLMFLVAAIGTALPHLLRRVGRHLESQRRRGLAVPVLILTALLIIVLGSVAASRVDTAGMGRNAITPFARSGLPRITARAADDDYDRDWRASVLDGGLPAEDLSGFRGAASGRNVVMIVLESASAEYLKTYGAAADPMPNLTKLAATSVIFEDAYSVYPESIKGLFSVLCSRYPAMDTEAESYAQITTPSIAAALRQEGYRTALFHSGRFMYLGMDAVVENRGYEVLEDAGTIGGNRESSFGVDEFSTVHRALAWIDSLPAHDRFLLTYLPIAGHHPYDTPERGPFPEQAESDRHLNALHYADESMGALISGLRERGVEDRTLFVVFGDHGEAFGQHEGNYGHSFFLYDENVRVPYLIAAPGLIKEQLSVARPISLIDTAPTILDLVGFRPPPTYQGVTMLEGRSTMALFYTDYSLTLMGLRDGCWKFIYERESGRSKLFDVCSDAAESVDLSSAHTERVAGYRARLSDWASAQKAWINRESHR